MRGEGFNGFVTWGWWVGRGLNGQLVNWSIGAVWMNHDFICHYMFVYPHYDVLLHSRKYPFAESVNATKNAPTIFTTSLES